VPKARANEARANDSAAARNTGSAEARKTLLLRRVLELSQQAVLLVDWEGLAPLLDEKERVIADLRRVDEELAAATADAGADPAGAAERDEQARLLAIVLENEATVEVRMDSERERLRVELRELERETRLRGYLERPAARRMKVDLKR
jgi:hypothetical protein